MMKNSDNQPKKKSVYSKLLSTLSIFDWRNWSLFAKMASTIVLLVVVIVVVLSYLAFNRIILDSSTELKLRSESRLNTLIASSYDALYWLDVDTLKHLADRMLALDDVQAVHFFDPDGRVLVAVGDTNLSNYTRTLNIAPGASRYLNSENILFEDHGDIFIAGGCVKVGRNKLGAVSISISTVDFHRSLQDLQNQIVLIAFLAILSGSVVALLLSRIVTTPLEQLAHATKQVGEGKLNQTIEISSTGGEIAQLAQAMETMRLDLARLYKDLEYQVEQRTVERERLEILSQFVNNISHDFRTPLSIIHLEAQLLQRTETGDSEKSHARLDTILMMVKRLNLIIEDMFVMSRLDNLDTVELSKINANHLLEMLIATLQPAFQDNKLELVVDLSDGVPLVMAHQQYLSECCKIMLKNAIQYTPEQGTITIKTYQIENNIAIEITDTGIGIAEDERERIFERLYRVDSARRLETGGSGLGLAIARRIIQLHQGSIQVRGELGKGSSFIIMLPLS